VNKNKLDAEGGEVKNSSAPILPSSYHVPRVTKKKGGGYLRHSVQSLKRIARLSDKDRQEMLHMLRKKENG